MIQELLFSGGDRRTITTALVNGGIIAEETAASAKTNPSSNNSNNIANITNSEQNLRCPRCDSLNTKFCYYNNYNLTQPRHFCKTCRRYWTKGGALRNVPIGGGCRKNRPSFTTMLPATTASKSSTAGKSSKVFSAESLLKSAGLGSVGSLQDLHESSLHNPNILWSSPHQSQTSHLLDFLRSTQNSNPGSVHTTLNSSQPLQRSYQAGLTALNLLNGQTPLSESAYPTSGLCNSILLRDNNQALAHRHQQPQEISHQKNGRMMHQIGGQDNQNSGIQELYQRLKLSTNPSVVGGNNNNNGDHIIHGHHAILGNVVSSSAASSPALDATTNAISSRGNNDLGLWNIPAAYYLPAAANGACPY